MPVIVSLKITLADMQKNHNKTVIQLVFLRHVSKWKDCDSVGAPNFACQEGKKCLGMRALYNYTNFNSFPTLSFHDFSSTRLNFIMRD
jgi:hypothetical protein